MKVSTHSYNSSVFASLLDGLNKDFILQKKNDSPEPIKQAQVEDSQFFSQKTKDDMSAVYEQEIESVAQEIAFASDRAKLAVSNDDFAKFAQQAIKNKWSGKQLQREAQKFCNQVGREIAHPQGTQKLSATELLENMNPHKIISASYPIDSPTGMNNSVTGKYIGSMRNPNTIWDTEAMTKQASQILNDEKIKASKEQEQKTRKAMKDMHWAELQEQAKDGMQVHNKILSASETTSTDVSFKAVAQNAMSMFDPANREFANIPEKTLGEQIAKKAEDRSNKVAESKSDWNQVKPAVRTRSSLDSFFDGLIAN